MLTQQEVLDVMERLSDTYRPPAQLLYGGGLRLVECMRLRVGDLDFPDCQIVGRDSEGTQGRVTVLAGAAADAGPRRRVRLCGTDLLKRQEPLRWSQPTQPFQQAVVALPT